MKTKPSPKAAVVAKHPSAFCVRATWGGYHIWTRNGFSPVILGYGGNPNQAWVDAAKWMKK